MKVLILFRWIYKKICIRSYLRHSGITRSPFRFKFERLIANNGLTDYVANDTVIVYKRGSNLIKYEDGKLYSDIIVPDEELSLDKLSYISDKRNVIPDLLTNGVNVNNSFYLSETWNDFRKASEEFKELNFPYLDVKLIKRKTQNGYKFYIEGMGASSDYNVKFEDSSSGMQNVAPMITIMDYFINRYDLINSFNRSIVSVLSDSDLLSKFKPVVDIGKINYKNLFFHIEEPELSLYPQSQLDLMNQIVDLCYLAKKNFDVNCMITTHSPYIANYINLLIKENKIDYNNVKVYEVIAGTVRKLNIDEKQLVNVAVLSEPISRIYDKYNEL